MLNFNMLALKGTSLSRTASFDALSVQISYLSTHKSASLTITTIIINQYYSALSTTVRLTVHYNVS